MQTETSPSGSDNGSRCSECGRKTNWASDTCTVCATQIAHEIFTEIQPNELNPYKRLIGRN